MALGRTDHILSPEPGDSRINAGSLLESEEFVSTEETQFLRCEESFMSAVKKIQLSVHLPTQSAIKQHAAVSSVSFRCLPKFTASLQGQKGEKGLMASFFTNHR